MSGWIALSKRIGANCLWNQISDANRVSDDTNPQPQNCYNALNERDDNYLQNRRKKGGGDGGNVPGVRLGKRKQ